ncbi:MAG: hypothetical protein J5548_12105 [Prevotella sp.]|nr:hypothetical protein [Prevotella sp.]
MSAVGEDCFAVVRTPDFGSGGAGPIPAASLLVEFRKRLRLSPHNPIRECRR